MRTRDPKHTPFGITYNACTSNPQYESVDYSNLKFLASLFQKYD